MEDLCASQRASGASSPAPSTAGEGSAGTQRGGPSSSRPTTPPRGAPDGRGAPARGPTRGRCPGPAP
eukprot:1766276-Lingulodinium_polyedra.AAC.1